MNNQLNKDITNLDLIMKIAIQLNIYSDPTTKIDEKQTDITSNENYAEKLKTFVFYIKKIVEFEQNHPHSKLLLYCNNTHDLDNALTYSDMAFISYT